MKLKTEIVIDADRDKVWHCFDNPDNTPKWQLALKSVTLKSGTPGQPGAISELVYEEQGREVRMTEIVSERRDGYFMAGRYESDWGTAVIVNHFEDVEGGKTRWISYWNHTFRGWMKLWAVFAQGSMAIRVREDMERFRELVESQG